MNKRPVKRTICVLAAAIMMSCASGWSVRDRYEGIRKNNCRIYVRIPAGEDAHPETGPDLNAKIRQMARERCRNTLARHALFGGGASGAARVTPESIERILSSAAVRKVECFDEYCEGFVDFTLDAAPRPSDNKQQLPPGGR